MEIIASPIPTDLQRFIDKFEPRKYKLIPGGIEVRGITELHSQVNHAKNLIEKLELKLTVSHNSQMGSYGAFEVNVLFP